MKVMEALCFIVLVTLLQMRYESVRKAQFKHL